MMKVERHNGNARVEIDNESNYPKTPDSSEVDEPFCRHQAVSEMYAEMYQEVLDKEKMMRETGEIAKGGPK